MSDRQLETASTYHRRMAAHEATQARKLTGNAARDARARRQLWLQLADEIDSYLSIKHAPQESLLPELTGNPNMAEDAGWDTNHNTDAYVCEWTQAVVSNA